MSTEQLLSKRIFARIALLQLVVLFPILFLLAWNVRREIREIYIQSLSQQLSDFVEVLSKEFTRDAKPDAEWCAQKAANTQYRISLIASDDGHSICDNVFVPSAPISLLDRPEVQAALAAPNHRGQSFRLSKGLSNTEGIYTTAYVPEQNIIVRAGLTVASFQEVLTLFDKMFLGTVLLLSLALIGVLQWTTRGILFKRATQAVTFAEKKLQEDLVANVSHEFRTPLTAIRGFADASIQDLKSGGKVELEHLEIIRGDANRLLDMVNDLLDFSAIDSGAMVLSKEEIPVREITEEVLARLQMIYGGQNPVTVHEQGELVFADPDRLVQILTNLLSNSMKYCSAGTSIRVEWREGDGGTELVISDQGPGIPEEVQKNIFNRFVRGSAKGQSTGLGLAIVKALVEAHSGTLEFSSAPGEGTRFTVKFLKNPRS